MHRNIKGELFLHLKNDHPVAITTCKQDTVNKLFIGLNDDPVNFGRNVIFFHGPDGVFCILLGPVTRSKNNYYLIDSCLSHHKSVNEFFQNRSSSDVTFSLFFCYRMLI